jgi:hypothetical protein
MAEIHISICMESHRGSLPASVRVSVGVRKAGETRASTFAETEIGKGPLLPEKNSMSCPIDISVMNIRAGVRE